MHNRKFILGLLLFLIFQTGFSQKKSEYSPFHIKELLLRYDSYSDVIHHDYTDEIWSLFYYNENDTAQKVFSNVYADSSWYADNGPSMLSVNEFIARYKKYFGSRLIFYDTLYNDKVVRKYNFIGYDLYVVKATWEIKHKKAAIKRWLIQERTDTCSLYFSIASVKSEDNEYTDKIIRITDYSPNYSKFVPQSAELSLIPTNTRLNTTGDISESGIGFSGRLTANYLLTGKGNFNLFFSPGLGSSYYQFGVKMDSINYAIDSILDYDKMKYSRLVSGHNIEQDFRLNYFDIPLSIMGQWYVKNFRFQANAGVNIGILTSSSVKQDIGTVKYSGKYNLGTPEDPWIVILEDLKDKYGFAEYNVKTIDDFSYLNPVNISAIAGVGIGYTPDGKIEFNLGLSTCFGLHKIVKSDSPEYLTEKDGEIHPLFYTDEKPVLNNIGLQVGLRYNIKTPNVPYNKEVDRKLINMMKYEEYEVSKGYATVKTGFYLGISGTSLGKLNSVAVSFNGINDKDDFTKNLKIKPKASHLKVNLPADESLINRTELAIQKPFSYNITKKDEANPRAGQIDDQIVLIGKDMQTIPPEGLQFTVTQIPTFDLFYFDLVQKAEHPKTNQIYKNLFTKMEDDAKQAKKSKDECLMYYNSTSPMSYNTYDSLDLFLQKVSQSVHSVTATSFEDLVNAMNKYNIDLSRRRVNIYVYTASLEIFRENVENLLINQLLKMPGTINNWKNIYVTVYTEKTSIEEEKGYIFRTDRLPLLMSNWKFIRVI